MRPGLLTLGLFCATATWAQDAANAPLSAIDWLSRSIEVSVAAPGAILPRLPDEAPVANSAAVPEISVTSLDQTTVRTLGLLPSQVTGLPLTLWSGTDPQTLINLIHAKQADALPAVQDLLATLMLAEVETPPDPGNALLLARVDKLLDIGALDPARALLESAGVDAPQLYRRWFDVSLLTGTEDQACEELRNRPALAPTYPARVFCLARNGDWAGAALTLNTARALGDITDEEDALLSRFLDPAISEAADEMAAPTRASPLVFLMREAIGEALPTAGLPLAFAHADLRTTAAWRSQIEAAERLARNGAVSEDVLRSVYLLRTPAASGGVWDRAEAIQRFDTALRARDPGAVAASLPGAWDAMKAVRTEVPFARLYAAALISLPLADDAGAIAVSVGLLSADYEEIALDWSPTTPRERLLQAIARGDVSDVPPPTASNELAVFAAFANATVPQPMAAQIADGKLGEALLRAISAFAEAATGDQRAMTDGLTTLRAVGLEDAARRIGLQYLILERPS